MDERTRMHGLTLTTSTPPAPTGVGSLAGQTLVILGLARQGKALARFAATQGARVVASDLRSAESLQSTLAELSDLPITYVLGDHPLSLLEGADLLALSGGVPVDAPIVQAAQARGIRLTNDAFEFLVRCPAPTVGITGSAGKSTTTALVGAMGQADGRTTWVGGNFGNPLIAELGRIQSADLVVIELSSFQLEQFTRSPQTAAILNITPNHLDRHHTLAAYTAAKSNILRWQTASDVAVLPADSLAHLAPLTPGRVRHFGLDTAVQDGACLLDEQIVVRHGAREIQVCTTREIQLRGRHNLLNVLAAVTLADTVGISAEAMRLAIRNFTGIPHRLEPVARLDGVLYVNDSIATAPERALAALRAFSEPIILLAGGKDKDLPWAEWAAYVAQRVKLTILFGELAPTLASFLSPLTDRWLRVANLEAAVAVARAQAQAGDVVLLAPGGTSFDAYVDFAARGQHFRDLVRALATTTQG